PRVTSPRKRAAELLVLDSQSDYATRRYRPRCGLRGPSVASYLGLAPQALCWRLLRRLFCQTTVFRVHSMKASIDAIIQREQAEYLDRLLPENAGLLAEMEGYAAEHRVPIADREVAAFLEITARAIGARRVLECGMAIGYSVIHLARAMTDDGLVVTIDPSDEMIEAAEGYLSRAGLRVRVQIEKGYA